MTLTTTHTDVLTSASCRQAAAIHESGHAVVAVEQGYLLRGVEVSEDGSGWCGYSMPAWENSPAGRCRQLIVAYAGPVAERVVWSRTQTLTEYIAEQLETLHDFEGESDLELEELGDTGSAMLILREVYPYDPTGVEAERDIEEAVQAALEIVTHKWSEIEAMAARVLSNTTTVCNGA